MTVTITFARLASEYTSYRANITRPLFVVLLDTKESMSEFAEATKRIKPISFPIWLVVFLQRPGNPLEEHCRRPTANVFNVDFSTQMLVVCYARPILVEWYALRDNRTRTFDLALWTPNRGLLLRTRKSIYARRSNMHGDVVRVTSVKNSPLVSYRNGTLDGFFGQVLIELSKEMNFTIEILKPVEGFGSWSEENRKWIGSIGQLVANKADIGVSAFTMTTRRQKVIDFSVPLIRSRYRLFFKEPQTAYVQWTLYLKTFSYGIWISLMMIIITTSILLTFMKAKGYFSLRLLFDNYISVWGIYCQQGLPEFPKESPIRLVFLSLYISSIIILAVYSASLISYLALSTPRLPFSTLEGYVKDGTYKFIVMRNSAEYDVPSRAKDAILLKMYDLLEKKAFLPHRLSEGFKQMCEKSNLAFYTTEVFHQAINFQIKCNVVYIDTGRIDNLAMTLTKGNPYTSFINYHLRRFQLNGVMGKLKNKYLSKKLDFSGYMSYGVVDLSDITPSLTMVGASMIVALLVLIIEKGYYLYNNRSKNNKLAIKKFNYNLGVRNQLQKRNNQNLTININQKLYNTRPIGYWP
ncbi:probable glutamate receptor [Cardiocondyla obscurior]